MCLTKTNAFIRSSILTNKDLKPRNIWMFSHPDFHRGNGWKSRHYMTRISQDLNKDRVAGDWIKAKLNAHVQN